MLTERAHQTTKRPGLRGLQRARTRAALLAAAREVLREKGYAGATSRLIAERAGVAVGTFFVHFADVAALTEALLDERLGAALERAEATLPRRGLVKQLVHVSTVLYESYAQDPALSRAALEGSLFRHDPTGPAAKRLAQFQAWVTERLSQAVRRRELAPQDPALVFFLFFSVYFALLTAGLRGEVTPAQQRRVLTQSLERLLGTER